jgi:hypothetical protein
MQSEDKSITKIVIVCVGRSTFGNPPQWTLGCQEGPSAAFSGRPRTSNNRGEGSPAKVASILYNCSVERNQKPHRRQDSRNGCYLAEESQMEKLNSPPYKKDNDLKWNNLELQSYKSHEKIQLLHKGICIYHHTKNMIFLKRKKLVRD